MRHQSGPPATSSDTTQTFTFAGEPGASFMCALDGAALAPCSSPITVSGLNVGDHTFRVAQVDAAGNTGPAQTTSFKITPTSPPEPTDTATGAKIAVSPGRQVVAIGGKVTIGCAATGGPMRNCAARIVTADGTVLAQGNANTTDPNATSLAVTLSRTRAGRLALRDKPNGVPAFIEVTLTTPGGRTFTKRVAITFIATDWVIIPTGLTSKLTKAQKRQVTALRIILTAAKKVSCVGYTSTQRGVSARQAKALTLRQAKTACELIKRLAPKVTTVVVARSTTRPRATNKTAAGRKLNQRIVIKLA